MIILGVDPALTNLGWAVVNTKGQQIFYVNSGNIINEDTKTPMPFRLATIIMQLEAIINQYQPNIVVMEETFVNKNAVSSLKLGYIRGAVMSLIGKFKITYAEYKPNLIKKTVVGSGHADKQQILHMVKIIVSGANKLNDCDQADALAIAYTYFVLNKFCQLQ